MERATQAESLVRQLEKIFEDATPDSILRDLERARTLVSLAAPEVRPELEPLLEALERLQFWLHDR